MQRPTRILALVATTATLAACGGGGGSPPGTCDPGAVPTGCAGDYTCEVLVGSSDGGSTARCFPPAYLDVTVLDPTDGDKPISGARVVALDAETGSAAAPAVVTGSSGVARVPVVWPRSDPDLEPARAFLVRVNAPGYRDYPGPMRMSLPVSVQRDPTRPLEPARAVVRLVPIDSPPKGSIRGTVLQSDGKTPASGVLVVAETSTEPLRGYSAISDARGEFVMYNVDSRSYALSAFMAGVSFPQTTVSVSGAEVQARLVADATPLLATVTGQVNIVASGGSSTTTVVLRMRSTWDVPPGLGVTVSSGPFSIPGVPTGIFEAVAGWGNDGLVLDPDPNIAGTQVQEVSVVGQNPPATVPLAGAFKVTDAVQILGPGATSDAELVSGAPIFRWKKYAQASFYKVFLWDGIAPEPIWSFDGSQQPTSGETVSYPGAPALVPGFLYRWWVEAWSETPTARPLSRSEDQLGVFLYVGE